MCSCSNVSSSVPGDESVDALPPVAGGADPAPIDPRRSYEALGRFIERRSPYEKVVLPDFGPGSLEGDVEAMKLEDTADPDMHLKDKHVLIEKGRYKDFHEGNPSNLKAEVLERENPGYFPKWDLGDGVGRNIVKEVQIHYKHVRKIDKQPCYVSVVVLYLGDAH
jgi:hypothetical protein